MIKKNIRSSFFLFWCQEYKYCNEGQVWVRHLLSSLSQCQKPVFHIARKAYICVALLHGDHCNVFRSLRNKSWTVTHASKNTFFII